MRSPGKKPSVAAVCSSLALAAVVALFYAGQKAPRQPGDGHSDRPDRPRRAIVSDASGETVKAALNGGELELLEKYPGKKVRDRAGSVDASEITAWARQAAPLMRRLVKEDPAAAYRFALPADTWRKLPADVQPMVARRFSERGLLVAYHDCTSGERRLSLRSASIDTALVSAEDGVVEEDGNFHALATGVAFEELAGLVAMGETEGGLPSGAYGGDLPEGGASYSYSPFVSHNLPKSGTLKVLYLIVQHSDETSYPISISTATNTLNQTATLLSNYSNGKVTMTYDIAQVAIAAATTASETTILDETAAVAFALGYNPDDYDSITRRTRNKGNFAWFFTKEIFMRIDNPRTQLHEIGHNYGLQHANWWRPNSGQPIWADSGDGQNVLYQEDFDAMSNSPHGDFNAAEKQTLTWLAGNEVAQDVGAGIYRIYPYDSYNATFDSTGVDGAHYAVSTFKDTTANNGGSASREYFISMRNQPEHGNNFNPWFTNGIVLHWKPWTRNGSSGFNVNAAFGTSFIDTKPLSHTSGQLGQYRPGGNAEEQHDGALLIGQTYIDSDPGNRDGTIHITPLGKTDPDGIPRSGDEYIDVKIAKGSQTGNQPPTASWTLGPVNVEPGATFTASVTASDPDDARLGYFWDFGLGPDGLSRRLMPLDGSPTQNFVWNTEDTYTLTCVVTDGRGETVTLTQEIVVSQDGNLAGKPTGLVAGSEPDGSIILDWDDNSSPEFTSYNIYRRTSSGSYGSPLATGLPVSGYTDEDTEIGETYFYVVTTIDSQDGESVFSDEASPTSVLNAEPPVVSAGPDQVVILDGSSPWTPSEISTAGWYDASDASTITESGGAVSEWADKGGGGFPLAQDAPDLRPHIGVNMINGLTTVKFDGSNDSLVSSDNPFEETIEDALVIAVHRHDASANGTLFNLSGTSANTGRWQAHAPYGSTLYFDAGSTGGGARISANYGVAVGDEVLVSFYGSTAESVQQVRKNGALLVGDASGLSTPVVGDFSVGSGIGTQYQNTSIGELIVINGTVSAEARQNLEGYLAHKWGLAGSLPDDHPHKDAAPGGSGALANLDGSVSDPDGGAPAVLWTQISGPAAVIFGDATAADTTATFSEPGAYVLRLTADDGLFQAYDEMTVVVSDGIGVTDTNNNGIDDAWEILYFDALDVIDGGADSDGDGVTDFFEYLHGSDPTDPGDSGFRFALATEGAGDALAVSWVVKEGFLPGTHYEIEVSSNLGRWDPLPAEHYAMQEMVAAGKTSVLLTLTHDYGDRVFLRLSKP